MSERVILQSEEHKKKLVEWRDPLGKTTEWVLEDFQGNSVLFRWEGTAGINATLFPATQTLYDTWFVDTTAVDRTFEYCRPVWTNEELMGSWLAECQKWFPDTDWTPSAWKNAFVRSVLPWLSKSDPWLSFREGWFHDELRPLFQASSLAEGLNRVGFRSADSRLVSRVEQSILAATGDVTVNSVFLEPVLWSIRCLHLLQADDLLTFWNLPNYTHRDRATSRTWGFPYELKRFEPNSFYRILDSIKTNPQPGDCWFDLIWHDRPRNAPKIVDAETLPQRRTLHWLDGLRWFYENNLDGWSTRLPATRKEVQSWSKELRNPPLSQTSLREWKPGTSILVGLFLDGTILSVQEWNQEHRKLTSDNDAGLLSGIQIHSVWEKLLPWIFQGRLNGHAYDLERVGKPRWS